MSLAQIDVILVLQGTNMKRNGIPNNVLSNINELTSIILIPLMSTVIYPALWRVGIKMLPVTRLITAFVLMVIAMVYTAVLQVI